MEGHLSKHLRKLVGAQESQKGAEMKHEDDCVGTCRDLRDNPQLVSNCLPNLLAAIRAADVFRGNPKPTHILC